MSARIGIMGASLSTRLLGCLVVMATPAVALAQGAASGPAPAGAGPSPGSDWTSLWWIAAVVAVAVLAAIFIGARRRRP